MGDYGFKKADEAKAPMQTFYE